MADETETPTEAQDKPAARRRAPRKTAAATPASTRKSRAKQDEAAPAPPKHAAPKAAKPRAAKRPTPKPAAKPAPRKDLEPSPVAKATEAVGGRWGAAAIAGGVAAVGAAAALLTLRGSTPRKGKRPGAEGAAHQPDGADASASFQAGIADEGTIPE